MEGGDEMANRIVWTSKLKSSRPLADCAPASTGPSCESDDREIAGGWDRKKSYYRWAV